MLNVNLLLLSPKLGYSKVFPFLPALYSPQAEAGLEPTPCRALTSGSRAEHAMGFIPVQSSRGSAAAAGGNGKGCSYRSPAVL